MHRLTVPQLFKTEEPTIVNQNASISSLFFTDDHIYLIDTTAINIIKKMTLKNFKVVQNFQIPQPLTHKIIKSLTQIGNLIVFAVHGSSDLHYINVKRQFLKVNSHLEPINQVVAYREGIATCSDDFTVRIWNVQKGQLIPSKTKHAYFGHTGKVTCFQKYEDFLISGSADQTVIFWRKDQNHCSFKSSSAVKNILACGQSNQFLVFSQNGQISVLNWAKISQYKKAQVNRVIKYSTQRMDSLRVSFTYCNEIDDSFVWFSDGNSIIFAEINLGQIITKKELCEQKQNKIVNTKSIGRMLLYGRANDSMYLLRF